MKLKSEIRDKLLETAVIHGRPCEIGSDVKLRNSISFLSIREFSAVILINVNVIRKYV